MPNRCRFNTGVGGVNAAKLGWAARLHSGQEQAGGEPFAHLRSYQVTGMLAKHAAITPA